MSQQSWSVFLVASRPSARLFVQEQDDRASLPCPIDVEHGYSQSAPLTEEESTFCFWRR